MLNLHLLSCDTLKKRHQLETEHFEKTRENVYYHDLAMANFIGIAMNTYRKIITYKTEPNLQTLSKFCKFLETTPDRYYYVEDEK